MIKLYSAGDPVASDLFRWPFVYLDGELEKLAGKLNYENSWDTADDIFVADHEVPDLEGYNRVSKASFYGHQCRVFLYKRLNRGVMGLVVLESDEERINLLMDELKTKKLDYIFGGF